MHAQLFLEEAQALLPQAIALADRLHVGVFGMLEELGLAVPLANLVPGGVHLRCP